VAKRIKNPPSPWDFEVRLLAWLATCVSVFSLLFYFQRGEVLLYGDAVAHLNIARRVFDSKTPGLLQLGTVWLPLPHLLMIPFLISNKMWRLGVGGSIPSMFAYVLGTVGMFRLVRGVLSRGLEPDGPARIAAWIAALVYAGNPNLIYMQATAMGESLYLAFFVWAVAYFCESVRGDGKALTKCGLCLAAACLTRYDGWFLAVAMSGIAILLSLFVGDMSADENRGIRLSRSAVAKFVLIAAFAPMLWLAYNGIVYRNPLEFENGPYSAKAIERRTQSPGNPGHPGSGNILLASRYFLKSAEGNVAENELLQRGWVLLLIVATAAGAFSYLFRKDGGPKALGRRWSLSVVFLTLLLIPLPFYALSVAYSGVPIFVPSWWPFSHYNVRYGLQLLPAFAAAIGIAVALVLDSNRWSRRVRFICVLALVVFVIASYASVWVSGPISLREAQVNMRTRNQLEAQLAIWLQKLPSDSTLLMYLGDHVGAVQRAGIPLSHVINEGNHRVWKQPVDIDGLWERALADPSKYVDYVVASEGDAVWQAIQNKHLQTLVEIHVTGQARAVLYRAR